MKNNCKIVIDNDDETELTYEIDTEKYKDVKFLLFETGNPDDYFLKLIDSNGKLKQYGYALVNDMKTSQYLQDTLGKMNFQDKKNGICVLCHYNNIFKKWKPIRIVNDQRPDNLANLR